MKKFNLTLSEKELAIIVRALTTQKNMIAHEESIHVKKFSEIEELLTALKTNLEA